MRLSSQANPSILNPRSPDRTSPSAGQARIHGRLGRRAAHPRGRASARSEIYRALRDVPEVREAIAVEQRSDDALGGSRVVLLRRARATGMRPRRPPHSRTSGGRSSSHASPTHVPELVVAGPRASGHPQRQALRAGGEGCAERPPGGATWRPSPTRAASRRSAGAVTAGRRRAGRSSAGAVDDAVRGSATEARLRAIWEGRAGRGAAHPGRQLLRRRRHVARRRAPLPGDPRSPGGSISRCPPSCARRPRRTLAAVIDSPPERPRARRSCTCAPGRADRPLVPRPLPQRRRPAAAPARTRASSTDRPVYGLQAHGLDSKSETPQTRVEEMAAGLRPRASGRSSPPGRTTSPATRSAGSWRSRWRAILEPRRASARAGSAWRTPCRWLRRACPRPPRHAVLRCCPAASASWPRRFGPPGRACHAMRRRLSYSSPPERRSAHPRLSGPYRRCWSVWRASVGRHSRRYRPGCFSGGATLFGWPDTSRARVTLCLSGATWCRAHSTSSISRGGTWMRSPRPMSGFSRSGSAPASGGQTRSSGRDRASMVRWSQFSGPLIATAPTTSGRTCALRSLQRAASSASREMNAGALSSTVTTTRSRGASRPTPRALTRCVSSSCRRAAARLRGGPLSL